MLKPPTLSFVEELKQKQRQGKLKTSQFKSKNSPMKNWKDISLSFTPQLKKEWKNYGFTYQQTKSWIDIGLLPTDAEYTYWLAQVLRLEPLTVLNEGNDADLREQFKEWKHEQKPTPQFSEKELLKTIELLEQDLADALAKIENYEREQSAAITAFNKQEKNLIAKDKQLEQKDNLLSEKEEKINQLKTRIKELTDKSKVKDLEAQVQETNSLLAEANQQIKELQTNLTTCFLEKEALELALFEKRLESLKEFSNYREKVNELVNTELTELAILKQQNQQLAQRLNQLKNSYPQKPLIDKKWMWFMGIILILSLIIQILK